jgi:hypothetical protein
VERGDTSLLALCGAGHQQSMQYRCEEVSVFA